MKRANLTGAAAVFALMTSAPPPADALDLIATSPEAGPRQGLTQLADTVHHGPHGTTVHRGPQGAVHHEARVTTAHPGPRQAAVHHGAPAPARHAPQGAYVHRGPGGQHASRPPYRPGAHSVTQASSPVKAPSATNPPPAPASPPATAAWTRPRWYSWAPGGAVTARVAMGFLNAAAVTAWAPPPPKAGLCWYYTDQSQKNGFWDVCP